MEQIKEVLEPVAAVVAAAAVVSARRITWAVIIELSPVGKASFLFKSGRGPGDVQAAANQVASLSEQPWSTKHGITSANLKMSTVLRHSAIWVLSPQALLVTNSSILRCPHPFSLADTAEAAAKRPVVIKEERMLFVVWEGEEARREWLGRKRTSWELEINREAVNWPKNEQKGDHGVGRPGDKYKSSFSPSAPCRLILKLRGEAHQTKRDKH